MTKEQIIAEIKRIANENHYKPPGIALFEQYTGIKQSDWYGIYWAKWGDALLEAGYTPNTMQKAYDEEYIIEKFIELIKEINKFPSSGELRLKSTKDKSFPSHNTFNKLGNIQEKAQKIIDYCERTNTNKYIIALCRPICSSTTMLNDIKKTDEGDEIFGFVYLVKSSKYYKIGKSNSSGRRCYELGIQLPEKLKFIHEIRTDDPSGIEEYWHKRFKDKRRNGEWFELNSVDVKCFTRRKFM